MPNLKRIILILFTIHYSLFTSANAGLTDFKTIEKANQAYEEKEYAKSATLLNSLDAKSPQKQYDIGNALYKDKKYDEAIEAYEKAEGVDEATRLHNIGNTQFQKKELDKAIEAYENALKLKEDEDTRFNLELAKKQKKKEEEQKKQDQKDKKDDKNKDDKKNDDKKDQKNKDDKKQDKDKKDQDKKDQDKKNKDGKKKEGEKDKNDSKKEKDPKLAKKLGATTLFLDAIKGVVVILVAKVLGAPESVLWTIAVLAVVGHCFSLFLGFEGGKGVATGFGVLLVMMPIPALIAIVVWLGAAKGLKISSLSSLIGLAAFIIASYVMYPEVPGIGSHAPIWIIAFIIFYKHIPNIVRMVKKEEGKV